MSVNQLAVNGKFNDEELAELQVELQQEHITVCRGFTKGIDAFEIVRMIFHNYDVLSFLRDGILFEILTQLFNKTLKWAKNKKPNAEIQIAFELNFGDDKPIVTVGLPFDQEKSRVELKKVITIDFIDSLRKGEIISIAWDKDKDEIKVIRF